MEFSVPSVGARVRASLYAAIVACGGDREVSLDPQTIPLTPDRDEARVGYRSAIAQRLAARGVGQSATELATDIADFWTGQTALPDRKWGTISISPRANGALDIVPSARTIATWLTDLHSNAQLTKAWNRMPPTWPIAYALDRCASLLDAANREGWFSHRELADHWLDRSGVLRLTLPAERTTIAQLARITDRLQERGDRLTGSERQKLADRLAMQFDRLHRYSRPWEARHRNKMPTAIARLGLYHTIAIVLRLLF